MFRKALLFSPSCYMIDFFSLQSLDSLEGLNEDTNELAA